MKKYKLIINTTMNFEFAYIDAKEIKDLALSFKGILARLGWKEAEWGEPTEEEKEEINEKYPTTFSPKGGSDD